MTTTNCEQQQHRVPCAIISASADQCGVCVTCRNGGIAATCPKATKVNININQSQSQSHIDSRGTHSYRQWRTWQSRVKSLRLALTVRMSNVWGSTKLQNCNKPRNIPTSKRVIHINWPFHNSISLCGLLVNCCCGGSMWIVLLSRLDPPLNRVDRRPHLKLP